MNAARFVMAHEIAHYVLGHRASDRNEPTVEFEADEVALRATASITEGTGCGRQGLGLLAARLALAATELTEVALFIRRPGTHPPAQTRWERLCQPIEPKVAASVAAYSAGLSTASQAAQNMTYRLPKKWWDIAFAHPSICCDVADPEYYAAIRVFDQIGTGDPNPPADVLCVIKDRGGIDLTPVVQAVMADGLIVGLQLLDVDAREAGQLCDEHRPLSFRSLMEAVESSPALTSAPNATERHVLAFATATLLGGVLQGAYVE